MTIYDEIQAERVRQDEKHGPPDPSRKMATEEEIDVSGYLARELKLEGAQTMATALLEEVYEAIADADNPLRLREELIQVAAFAVKWIEALDIEMRKATLAELVRESEDLGLYDQPTDRDPGDEAREAAEDFYAGRGRVEDR